MLKRCPKCGNKEISENANYCKICGLKLKEAPEVPSQEQSDYTTEYRIDRFSRLILTTDKKFYDNAINNYNGIPIVMVGNFSEAEEIYLSQSGQHLYLVQIPLDK
ncbi:zinc ribbon domain-containing protein [Clostridium botulinum]|uniref:zinc ribbon domain-containing protein n=1 Tax=Clostridium botulinum TaxID=1491 RepID=UPI0009579B98|nr:zinc ribbon domain-containing protein [Clostridium botulinum]APU61246.1 zinc-ribbon domain protein [Clostridium botulinum]